MWMTDIERADTVGAVVNPASGTGDGEAMYAELVHRFLDAEVHHHRTEGPDDVPRATREAASADLLVSIGGDGTLREVATTLVDIEEPPPLVVLPAGRGNSVYQHLYGGRDWRALLGDLSTGYRVEGLDVGHVEVTPGGTERFVLGFTAGLFRSALAHAQRLDALPGPLAYLLGTARAVFGDDPVTGRLAVDDRELYAGDARLFGVGGGRYRGSAFETFPDSRPGDGHVHAIAIEAVGLTEAIQLVRLARENRLLEHPAVHHATGERATLTAEAGLPVELDGTPLAEPVTRAELTARTELTYATSTEHGV